MKPSVSSSEQSPLVKRLHDNPLKTPLRSGSLYTVAKVVASSQRWADINRIVSIRNHELLSPLTFE